MKKIYDQKYFISHFLIVYLLLNLIFGGVFLHIYNTEIQAGNLIIWSQERNQINLQKQVVSRDFREIISDIKAHSKVHEIEKNIKNMEYDSEGVISDFYNLSKHKGLCDQIRYLDIKGMEIIRINYNNGYPEIVDPPNLQNKFKRYYFQDTLKLKENEVFISPLDLNIEHGQIETPIKPMIRFGVPLFHQNGEPRGVLLFNYLAKILIENLNNVASKGYGQFSFLNSQGYWLTISNTPKSWGFMYNDRQDMTFGNDYPNEWKQILASDSNQFITENGIFTFATFYPLKNDQRSSTGSGDAFGSSKDIIMGNQYYFKLLSHVPSSVIKEKSGRVFKTLVKLYIGLNLIFIFGAFMFSKYMENRKQHSEERKELIEELKNALDEVKTLQGIIPICSSCKKIRDDTGYWNQIESYIQKHSDAEFTHGVCPECLEELYGKESWYVQMKENEEK